MWADTLTFLRAWAASPAAVGAIAPSSAALARQMVHRLPLGPGQAVVEFGPGTGPMTRAIAALLPDPAAYLGIEQDPHFVALLRRRFPQLRFVKSSVTCAPDLVAESGLNRIGAIICGIPFASLLPSAQDAVIDAVARILQPGSEFRTFQYVHAYGLPTAIRYRYRMARRFGPHRRSRPVMRNLPPAFVLTWRR